MLKYKGHSIKKIFLFIWKKKAMYFSIYVNSALFGL